MSVVMNVPPSSETKPHTTRARAPLTRSVSVRNELGEWSDTPIPAERALTIYLDKKELVTLMTLGAEPECLVLGFLRNQRLIDSVAQIESITVDWSIGEGEMGEPGVAAVKTRAGAQVVIQRSADRVVTTGCGQGSVFGDLMAHIDNIQLPPAQITQSQLYGLVNTIRLKESTYKSSGSVHGCALFQGEEMLVFVAGWMCMNDVVGQDKVFYTTGRLTSEMVIKSAQMGSSVSLSISLSASSIALCKFFISIMVGECSSTIDRIDPKMRMPK